MSANPPPGWYRDPQGQGELRYWDGNAWTEHTSVDPGRESAPVYDEPPAQPPAQQRSFKPIWLIPVAILLAAAGAGIVLLAGGGGADEAKAQTVQFEEPTTRGDDPFTEPADVEGDDLVPVGSGPFGGTGSDLVCDRELLIRSLKRQPEKLREWARVQDLTPNYRTVARYIRKLRPVTLTRDTRVTNHTFENGRAVGYQAILQAGTAVLVDEKGIPRARCRCGNPLLEQIFIKDATCVGCPPSYKPPPPCADYKDCWRRYPSPPPVRGGTQPGTPTAPAQPAGEENPSASFSPNPGKAGDAFTLSVSGFARNSLITFVLTRPDGVTEDYQIATDGSGSGSYGFPPDPTVLEGTYTADVRNPETGARTSASVTVRGRVESAPAPEEPPPEEESPEEPSP